MSRVQTIRTTEELFLPDDELRNILGLHDGDLILEIKRARGGYGEAQQRLDLFGSIVTVLRGAKKYPSGHRVLGHASASLLRLERRRGHAANGSRPELARGARRRLSRRWLWRAMLTPAIVSLAPAPGRTPRQGPPRGSR